MSRKINCDREGYEHVSITLPDEWLGSHSIVKDQTLETALELYPDNSFFINLTVALALTDKVTGVKQLQGKPEDWDIANAPLPVLTWIEATVMEDFLACFPSTGLSSGPFMSLLQEQALRGMRNPG